MVLRRLNQKVSTKAVAWGEKAAHEEPEETSRKKKSRGHAAKNFKPETSWISYLGGSAESLVLKLEVYFYV